MKQCKRPALKKAPCPFSNVEIVLSSIRASLGPDWTFYKECLEGIVGAAARQDDTAAWFEQMETLVKGKQEIAFDHAGILFFLRQVDIKLPVSQILSLKQHTQIDSTVKNRPHLRVRLEEVFSHTQSTKPPSQVSNHGQGKWVIPSTTTFPCFSSKILRPIR